MLDTLQIFGGTAYLLTGIARQLAPHCTYPSGLIIFKERISTHFKKKTKTEYSESLLPRHYSSLAHLKLLILTLVESPKEK